MRPRPLGAGNPAKPARFRPASSMGVGKKPSCFVGASGVIRLLIMTMGKTNPGEKSYTQGDRGRQINNLRLRCPYLGECILPRFDDLSGRGMSRPDNCISLPGIRSYRTQADRRGQRVNERNDGILSSAREHRIQHMDSRIWFDMGVPDCVDASHHRAGNTGWIQLGR